MIRATAYSLFELKIVVKASKLKRLTTVGTTWPT